MIQKPKDLFLEYPNGYVELLHNVKINGSSYSAGRIFDKNQFLGGVRISFMLDHTLVTEENISYKIKGFTF